MYPVRTALAVVLAASFTACTEAGPPPVERVDSAGIELVTSPTMDRPLAWSFAERFALGGEDEGPESFYALNPNSVGTDAAGRIHVLSGMARQVVTFDANGELVRAVGDEGGGPGEMERPASLGVTVDGAVSVFDYGKRALVQWGPNGEMLPEQRFVHPPMLAGRHHALFEGGYLVSTWGLVDGERANRLIRVEGEDTLTLAVAPQPEQGVVMFERCGGGINLPPLFTPSVVWDYRDGVTAVVPGRGYRIDLRRDGTLVRSIRRPFPLTEATRELALAQAGEGFTINFGRGPCTIPPGEYVDARGWAETVPAINRILLGPAGELWVERWVPDRDPMPIDVFDADGVYLGTLPEGTTFPVLLLPDHRVGVIRTDELDVARLVVADVVESGEEGS